MSFDAAAIILSLQVWDVIYPLDTQAKPKKHKMWVCVSKRDLRFIRINTRSQGDDCVPLAAGCHGFLEHDSFLGLSGDLISVVEVELEQLLRQQLDPRKRGIVGSIAHASRATICARIRQSDLLSPRNIEAILAELEDRG